MRKIKIIGKGLPKFQQQPGTITTGRMDIPKLQIDVPCPIGFKKDPSGKCVKDPTFDESTIDRPPADPNDQLVGVPSAEAQRFSAVIGGMSAQDLDKLWSNPTPKEEKKQQKLLTGPQLAMLSTGMLSEVADQMQRSDLQSRVNKTLQKFGQTDVKYPAMRNVYSYGRTPTGYSYSQMVPVQFAGAPAFQAMTYPQFAQDGIEVTRDILQMPTLFTSDPSAPGLYAQDPAIQEAMTRRYADVNLPTADITGVLASPAVGPTAAPASFSTSAMIGENLSLPLDPYSFRVSSGFGSRKAPKAGASTEHNGVDLGISAGSNIYSIKPGTVYQKWYDGKGGNQMLIKHDDGTTSGYAHMQSFAAKEGDRVDAGSIIGYVGSTGIATGPHLHFTYRDASGNRVDPSSVFNFTSYSGGSGRRKKEGQISFTHNNPLNIHFGDFARQYNGTKGAPDVSGNVAMFPDLNTGLQAAKDLLFGPSSSYINLTISEARNRWVNGNADSPSSSTPHIVKSMGKDVRLSQLSPAERSKLIKEFAKWEGRQGYNEIKNMPLYEEGGEYELNDDQIKQILANGGQVEYL